MTSKIKVDNINKVSDDSNIIKKCGSTTTVGSGSGNTVVVCGSTVTIGRCGGTVTLASGSTQTGFGRTGTVDWQTTPKTGDFTAANGEGYFVNTTSGAVTMTMPSGSAGSIVSIQDYNKTFDSNALIIDPASGQKINGGPADGKLSITTEGQGLTFVYVDGTVGWKTVHENEFTTGGEGFITATGGTITTSGNCKIHTFTGPGTFCVSALASTPANNQVSYMVVAGGGGGGGRSGGGGGAGGFREDKSPVTPYTASPLEGAGPITVTATGFPITVGGGGAGICGGVNKVGTVGNPSIFSTITSAGGGRGAGACAPCANATGGNGGSGGGGGYTPPAAAKPGGSGNTPPVSPAQGTNGGAGSGTNYRSGGGGGATDAGDQGNTGNGGDGATTSINGSPTTFAGGGGGGSYCGAGSSRGVAPGGPGGGGQGSGLGTPATAGTANTGGGGGGGGKNTPPQGCGQQGGSGIVIIRYKFQ